MREEPFMELITNIQNQLANRKDRKEMERKQQDIAKEMEEWKRAKQAEHDDKLRQMNEEAEYEMQKMREETKRKIEALHAKWDPIIERNERELAKFEEKYGKRT